MKPIKVQHKLIDGAHFYTSKDVPGLCAAHSDLQVAYRELITQFMDLKGHALFVVEDNDGLPKGETCDG